MLDDPSRGTLYIEDLEPGMERGLDKVISDADIRAFAEITTDRNPVHLDDDYAAATMFGGRIAHGILTAGLISAVIGQQLPGRGAIYLKQDLRFLAPVRPGETVAARVVVKAVDRDRRRVTLDCTARVGKTLVLSGEALVLAPSRSRA